MNDRREYFKTYNKNRESRAEYMREWRKKHPGMAYEYYRRTLKNNINFKLGWLLRARIRWSIKNAKTTKCEKSLRLIGTTIQGARKHIEEKFKPDMNWQNHGKIWQIDHILPISRFNLSDPIEQRKAFHYTNLQPLYTQDNLRKSNKIL